MFRSSLFTRRTHIECTEELLRCCICALPRWDFSRALASKFSDSNGSFGIAKAVHSIHEKTVSILSDRQFLVCRLIESDENPEYMRGICAKSLLTSLVYVAHSNLSYGSTSWKLTRGEISFGESYAKLTTSHCCDETGFHRKISNFARKKGIISNDNARSEINESFTDANAVMVLPNRFTTQEAEASFSSARFSGLPGNSSPTTCNRFSLSRNVITESGPRDLPLFKPI